MGIEQLGKKDGITHYNCEVCGTTFGIGGVHEDPPACPYKPYHSDADFEDAPEENVDE